MQGWRQIGLERARKYRQDTQDKQTSHLGWRDRTPGQNRTRQGRQMDTYTGHRTRYRTLLGAKGMTRDSNRYIQHYTHQERADRWKNNKDRNTEKDHRGHRPACNKGKPRRWDRICGVKMGSWAHTPEHGSLWASLSGEARSIIAAAPKGYRASAGPGGAKGTAGPGGTVGATSSEQAGAERPTGPEQAVR